MNADDAQRMREATDKLIRDGFIAGARNSSRSKAEASAARLGRLAEAEALLIEFGYVKMIRDDGSVSWESTNPEAA